jgi:hypothetical protein
MIRPSTPPAPMARGVSAALLITLWVALVLMPTTFGSLHRYASADLLFLVCLLAGLWVISSLVSRPLRYVRSWANPLLWAVLALVMIQILPLPGVGPGSGAATGTVPMLADGPQDFFQAHAALSGVGRYSLRPVTTSGVLMLVASAAALFWLLASSVAGRSSIRTIAWAVPLGLAPLALWGVLSLIGPRPGPDRDTFSPSGPVQILGGDSLVPALLAAMGLVLADVLRLLGWTRRRRARHRALLRRRVRRTLIRRGPVWAAAGLAIELLVATALGMSNVPVWVLLTCTVLTVGFVLTWYVGQRDAAFRRRRRLGVTAALMVLWILLGLGLGWLIGPVRQEARSADTDLRQVRDTLSGSRSALGLGAGAISDRVIFGSVGWPSAKDEDADTDGYLLLGVEIGWAGLALVIAGTVALAVGLMWTLRRARGPRPKLMLLAGLGVMASNILYFRYDAAALLAPNLLALAASLGVVVAWGAHGSIWRPSVAPRFRSAHWPLVLGAVGLIMTMTLSESEMLTTAPSLSEQINDKVMHFGAFGVVGMLLCYAINPRPGLRWLTLRVATGVGLAVFLAVCVEFGQKFLTVNRSFELMDAFWGAAGAVLAGAWWWVMRRAHVFSEVESGPAPSGPPGG